MDLREDRETLSLLQENGQSPVKREVAVKLGNKIRAVRYMECSALTQRGLKQVGFTIKKKNVKKNQSVAMALFNDTVFFCEF